MATAQQLFVSAFADLINNSPNLSPRVIASSPHPGILRVTQRGSDDPRALYLSGGSSVTGAGTFAAKAATGSPKYAELWFSWTLAPGDTVKINAGDVVLGIDLTYNLPAGTTVDAGGFDHTGYTPGGSAGGVAIGGSGIGSAQHRRLVVMECGSASSSFGAMFALDPQDATGVAIPTFRVVTSLPAAGSSQGESVYVTATRQGYVWDGTAWRDITASPIRAFTNDAQLQADTVESVGTYAVASDTGNMYVRTPGGWRRIGISEFATYADMLAYNAPAGSQAGCYDLGVQFVRVDNAGTLSWVPTSIMVKDEADILATQNIRGLTAVAPDTGSTFVNDGTQWIEDPIQHFATEVALLASQSLPGHIAWADDTAQVFVGTAGGWSRLQGPNVAVGTTQPTGSSDGDLWLRDDGGATQAHLEVFSGGTWVSATPSAPIGTIQQSLLNETQFTLSVGPIEATKWALADGRDVTGSRYATITGNNNIPDLRGAFLRMAGQNSTNAAWDGGGLDSWHEDTTRRPRNTAFTTSTNGSHTHNVWSMPSSNGSWWDTGQGIGTAGGNLAYGWRYSNLVQAAGNHSHTITGGGDAETAPKHYSVNYFIRIN